MKQDKAAALALADRICELLSDKKAVDILKIDVGELTIIADYFIICSGLNVIQVKTLCDHIDESLGKEGINPSRIEGKAEGRWVVLDYGSVIVHIFHDQERLFYHLEKLWSNGKNVDSFQ